jgi:MFS family permease
MSNSKKLGRNVVVLGIVSLCNDASSEMIFPLLPMFLTATLGATAEMLGIIEGIAESTAAVLKLFSGWLSDKLKKRKALAVAGYSLSAITRPLMAIATAGLDVLFIRFGDRVGKGVRTAPRDAMIADSTDPAVRGKAFGFHRAMDHVGAIIGPLLAMGILALYAENYRLVFWIAVIPAIIGVIVLIAGAEEIAIPGDTQATSLQLKGFDRNFYFYLVIVILFTLGNSSDAFLLLRARDLGVPAALIPILWLVLHVSKMASSMPCGSLSDKIGRKKVIIFGWIIYALTYAGFASAASSWQPWVLFAVYGLFFGFTEGTEKAFVADLVKPEQRGTAYGIFNFAIGIGALPASVIMGILWHRHSPVVAFGFGATLALLASVLLIGVRTPSKTC